jgi:glycosyltransferase involved in cell wall biosynthesis
MSQLSREYSMSTELAEMPSISVIIPAFNEAGYISETLKCLSAAEQRFKSVAAAEVEILVVNNASTDSTAELARSAGATVVYEAEHSIAKVRNVGAAAAFRAQVKSLDISEVLAAFRPPWPTPYAERLIGSIRRECLDQVVIINELSLRRHLVSYLDYYHGTRSHLSALRARHT